MANVARLLDAATIERLNHLSLNARRIVEGNTTGSHRSAFKGTSIEFRQRRPYSSGDEPRRIDWRLLARTDRLFVKEYDEETNLRCVIALDRSASMAYGSRSGSKLDYATRVAAALSYLLLSRNESVGIGFCGERLDGWIAPGARRQQLSLIVDALERVEPIGVARPEINCRQIADRLARRGLIIVISDFFSPPASLRSGLARLRHDRHELLLLQIVDRAEMNFPFKGVFRFIGMEGERATVVESAIAKRNYRSRLAAHQAALLQMSRTLRAGFFTFDTQLPPIEALSEMTRFQNR